MPGSVTVADIALTMQYGLGPKGIAHLLSVMGSADAVFSATEEELAGEAMLRRDLARDILLKNHHRQAEREMEYLAKHSLQKRGIDRGRISGAVA